MKIGIDTFGCDHGRSGIGSYLMSLVPQLPADKDIKYVLFGPEVDRYTYTGNKSFEYISVNVPDSINAERFWHVFFLNKFCKRNGFDAVIYAAGARMIPLNFSVKGIAVVNDLVSSLFKQNCDFISKHQIKRGLNKADCIIAASHFIRKDLEHIGIKNKNIKVIYNGINHSMFFPLENIDSSAEVLDIKPFAIKRPYFIYPSRMQNSEKMHVELIKAFTAFKEKTHLPHRLVIAGSEGPYGQEVHKAAFESSAASDIFITGYFPHESFPDLYHYADACIFPSVNEGVGLPVLEAMASGLPVACSKAGALHEITGDNALFFDSTNIKELSDSLEQISQDQKLRDELIQNGIAWTKRLSWEKTAESTIAVVKELLQNK